jgi:hypothetical protein
MRLQNHVRTGRFSVLRRTLIMLVIMTLLATVAAIDACAVEGSTDTIASVDSTTAAERADAARAMAAWNVVALRTTAAGPFSPPQETRSLAMVSAAVFDAVNAIGGRYEPFVARIEASRDGSRAAAVAAAAHRVLRTLYPAAATALDADYDTTIAKIPDGASKVTGISVGRSAADAVLVARVNDHASERVSYTPQSAAGMWTPTPPPLAAALEAGWGRVTPFVLLSGTELRPSPPPALNSAEYARDLAEIASIGAWSNATRTAAQTEAARFWISTAPQLWNQVVRQLTTARDLDPSTVARAYLLLNIAGADAMIAAWDAKFAYQQWRPITAIRRGAADGALSSPIDTTWLPLLVTPPFPDYPAGHTAYAGAAEIVLKALFGDQPGELAITSATAGGTTHKYQSFTAVCDEVVNARVWGGVHWRTSSTAGLELGRRVGALALQRAARAL